MKYGVIFLIKTNYLNATKTLYGVFMMHFIDMYGIRKRRWSNLLHYWELWFFRASACSHLTQYSEIVLVRLFLVFYFEDCMLVLVLISVQYWLKVYFWLLYRAGEDACTAYVTFKDPYSLETAVLLSVSHSQTVSIVVISWNYCSSK